MHIISHRGNLHGSDPACENAPHFIDSVHELGFDVEVDVWVVGGDFWLGHDHPQYKISQPWLWNRRDWLWMHCKNGAALDHCLANFFHCFYHDTDPYTLTSFAYVWAYPGQKLAGSRSIMVMPEWETDLPFNREMFQGWTAVCTDYPVEVSKCFEK